MALGGAVEYLLDVGIERVFEHDLRLTDLLVTGLRDLGAEFITPLEDGLMTSIVGARFPGKDSRDLYRRLGDADVFTSLRLDAVRFSPHLYNDEADVQRALIVLGDVLASPSS